MNKIFNIKFSGPFDQVFTTFFENLTENLTLHEFENFVHMVLNTRDYEDSASMFKFVVAIHKKG